MIRKHAFSIKTCEVPALHLKVYMHSMYDQKDYFLKNKYLQRLFSYLALSMCTFIDMQETSLLIAPSSFFIQIK